MKGVFAKSFARIHRRNLVAQGILAVTFLDDADYDRAEVGQTWSLPEVREELEAGSDTISVRIEESGDLFVVGHDFAPHESEILVAGGLLSYLRREDGDGGADGRGSDDDGLNPKPPTGGLEAEREGDPHR